MHDQQYYQSMYSYIVSGNTTVGSAILVSHHQVVANETNISPDNYIVTSHAVGLNIAYSNKRNTGNCYSLQTLLNNCTSTHVMASALHFES